VVGQVGTVVQFLPKVVYLRKSRCCRARFARSSIDCEHLALVRYESADDRRCFAARSREVCDAGDEELPVLSGTCAADRVLGASDAAAQIPPNLSGS